MYIHGVRKSERDREGEREREKREKDRERASERGRDRTDLDAVADGLDGLAIRPPGHQAPYNPRLHIKKMNGNLRNTTGLPK